MGNIIPFDQMSREMLAEIQGMFELDDSLVVPSGFPVISIKGGKWAVKRGGEREAIRNPQTGDLATAIEVVIVDYSKNVTRVFYATKYDEESTAAPDCYSNDGVSPAADAAEAKQCATCPHAQWGSRITENGVKAKACADTRRLAVATVDNIEDPMLLRVPPTSLKHLSAYQKEMVQRGVPLQMLVTKLSFDEDSSSPMLRFKPFGFVSAETARAVKEMQSSEVVSQIVGSAAVPHHEEPVAEEPVAEKPVDEKPAPKKAAPKKAAPKKAAKKVEEPAPAADEVAADDGDDDELFAQLKDFMAG
jgi:hypothetical protein